MHFRSCSRHLLGWLLPLFLGLATLLAPAAHAQTWQQALAGHFNQPASGSSCFNTHTATDTQGNIFVTGQFAGSITVGNIRLGNSGGNYLFVGKWSPTAKTWLWATASDGIYGASGSAIAVSGNNVYVTGYFYATTTIAGQTLTAAKAGTSSNGDMFLAKFVDNGSSFSNGWAVRGGGTGSDGGNSVAVVGSSVYVTGSFQGTATFAGQSVTGTNGYADMFLAKYTDNGSSSTDNWVATGGGPADDVGTRVVATSTGTVYVTGSFTGTATLGGSTLTSAGGTDLFLLKGTDQGATFTNTWVVRGGGAGADTNADLAVVGSALYITGSFAGTATLAGTTLTSKGGTDLYLAKYLDQGSTIANGWALAEGGTGSDGAGTLAASGTDLYLGGSFQGTATIGGRSLTASGISTDTDGLVVRYTDLGTGATPVWSAGYGGTSTDGARGLALGSTGILSVLVNASSSGGRFATMPPAFSASNSSALLTLTPATGAVQNVDAPYMGGESTVRALTRSATGDVYLAGEFTGTVGFGRTQLVAQGDKELFLAKWSAATGTWAWATASSGRSNSTTQALGIALSGANVYLTGGFSNTVTIAGQNLTVTTGYSADVFVAKYVDQGTSVSNGWAIAGTGGYYADNGTALVASGNTLYVTGYCSGSMALAGLVANGTSYYSTDVFLAKLTDDGSSPTGVWITTGGGTSDDHGYGLALNGSNLYVTGDYYGGRTAVIAGQPLAQTEAVNANGFLAKYVDQGSTYANGWVASLGGPSGADGSQSVAAVGSTLYVAGFYNASATVAGQTLTSAGGSDAFVAKYVDQGSTYANGWAASSGGPSNDQAYAVATDGTSVYVAGTFYSPGATFAGQALTSNGYYDLFVAKYTDQSGSATPGWAVGVGGPNVDYAYALALTPGGVYVGGSLRPTATVGATTFTSPSGNSLNFLGQLSDDAAPLPVQLVQFTVTANGPTTARLTWTTASEVNSAHFEVERSADGVTFATLGVLTAAGSSSTPRTYVYLDAATLVGTSYYRLRQVDQGGTSAYSPVQAVTLSAGRLAVYPNPSVRAATLTGAPPSQQVQVFDALGQVVVTATTNATGTAALGGLARGFYLVRVGTTSVRWLVE